MYKRRLLTPAEFDTIKKTRSFTRAIEALAQYVKGTPGPVSTGTAMTSTERSRLHRARLRQERGK